MRGGSPTPLEPPDRLVLHRLRLPLRQPHLAAHGTEDVRDLVLVEATMADGAVGWGECSALSRPTYTSEWADGAWLVLRDLLGPATLSGVHPALVGHPMAATAVATAVLDARLRRSGTALAHHLAGGEATRPRVPTTLVLGLAAPDLLVARAAEVRGPVKVKVHPGHDQAPLGALREAFPDRALAADANGTYDATDPDHLRALEALDALDLAYLEQPVAVGDLVGSARLSARLRTPIALDESLADLDALESALALRAGLVANVKPARVGGLEPAAALVARAADAGWDVFVGGMLESGVGRAAALAVAALPGCSLPTDLGPSGRYVARDVLVDPIEADEEGALGVPSGPGLGVAVDRDAVSEATVDRVELTR